MGTRDPRVDIYIAEAPPFAQPILRHVRDVMHATCPDVEETRARRLDQAIEWIAQGKPRNWKYMKR